jgi:predicted naringenin-chalcone synthase
MPTAAVYINRIATAVPAFDVHRKFLDYAPRLTADARAERLFRRMADRAQVEHRYSVMEPDPEPANLDRKGLFRRGAFPGTAARMRLYEEHALDLALHALGELKPHRGDGPITHLIVTSCTGFYAPGLDLDIIDRLELDPSVERTMVGFMGCQAALPAMKLAYHIVRADRAARVLILNLELCTLHLQETSELEELLSFVIFADGCAASIVSAEPIGVEMLGFRSALLPQSRDQITWHVRDTGFRMWLDGAVPATIARGLRGGVRSLLGDKPHEAVSLWAVHPGGRTILDAVETSLALDSEVLQASRDVLRDYGNMSSASVMFVLASLAARRGVGEEGCALAFGPGLTAEAMRFRLGPSA